MRDQKILVDLRSPERKRKFKIKCTELGKDMTEVLNQLIDKVLDGNITLD